MKLDACDFFLFFCTVINVPNLIWEIKYTGKLKNRTKNNDFKLTGTDLMFAVTRNKIPNS